VVETIIYCKSELIRSSQVPAARSAHNVLSVVTYQSVSSHLKVYCDRRMRVYTRAVWRSYRLQVFQIDRLLRCAAPHACHITGVALTLC